LAVRAPSPGPISITSRPGLNRKSRVIAAASDAELAVKAPVRRGSFMNSTKTPIAPPFLF
jgi:hypothetical protein